MLHQARCFAEITAGPQYMYNVLVARRAKQELGWDTTQVEEGQLGRVRDWINLVHERQEELTSWADELPAFWNLLDNRIPQSTRHFITSISRAAVDDPERLETDPAVHHEIRLREMQLKGRRARLGNLGALENWNQAPVGGQLSYRWSVVRRYLADLTAGLGAD